jgi:uncharacterized membrane protein YeaQ/YmgE (transglycosylase-associated protein family)
MIDCVLSDRRAPSIVSRPTASGLTLREAKLLETDQICTDTSGLEWSEPRMPRWSIVRGTGFGIIGDLIVGILDAVIGSWLLPQLGIHLGTGVISAIVNATVSAILLLLIVRLFRGGSGWASRWGGGWRQRW